MIDVLNTMNLLRERGVYLRSVSDGIDPTTTSGRLMLNMLATLAEYERELIVERVNAGIAAARQGGTRFGRPMSDPLVIADGDVSTVSVSPLISAGPLKGPHPVVTVR